MSDERLAISNGTFTFVEGEDKNYFYFYRNDGGVLGEVGRIPMDFYQYYICRKMMSGEITGSVMNNLHFERSEDEKCMRITVCSFGEQKEEKDTTIEKDAEEKIEPNIEQKTSFFKRIVRKMFNIVKL